MLSSDTEDQNSLLTWSQITLGDSSIQDRAEGREAKKESAICSSSSAVALMAPKPIASPVPDAWYPTLSVVMLAIGLIVTASFFIYEATSSRKNRSLAKELTTGAVASVFLGFGSLFLLISSGVYV